MMPKTICLVSGGIDSPVAAALMSKRFEIIPLHFNHYPFYCEESFALAMKVLERLKEITGFKTLVIVPWGRVLKRIHHELRDRRYACVLCRRAMLDAACRVAKIFDASSITTGEALGQKASQTLENLNAISHGIDCTIERPLIGMDKDEIVKISKELDLYMDKHVGCCKAVPEFPKTRTSPKIVSKLYEELNLGEAVSEAVSRIYKSTGDVHQAYMEYMKIMMGEDFG